MQIVDIYNEPVREYKPYKNEQYNKKLAKANNLLKSINETSLKDIDKTILKQKISQLFSQLL